MYIYNLITLFYTGNWDNTLNQIYFNKKSEKNFKSARCILKVMYLHWLISNIDVRCFKPISLIRFFFSLLYMTFYTV